ncbi:Gfo/Idh/MocA family protein [Dyadobacter frigoris]|uniref:Gfo/Idh/MocA family oxidoreductase n=1 Tax=Dyadobacter frigoris TaxID=2576211 RepID=A0A4U6CQ01_9BACT|nr:Gfo/Idh/MocA family oxidoreductase [Dyadobacter frigoris]TKT86559.1 Gfo/Idh/MocA family oxidoreductase [Dyadobacter frigoris]
MNRRNFLQSTVLCTGGLMAVGGEMVWGQTPLTEAGKRVGIIGLDTSHSEVFTKIINANHPEMKGYKVVAAYPHGTKDIASALKIKDEITRAVQNQGVEIVSSIDELLTKVDVILLESNDGRSHLEQALPVLKAGKRMFIDKPVAANLQGAIAIFNAAKQYNTPIFSSSALRFDASVQKIVSGSIGKITGADVYAPAKLDKNHSDLAWYAIHGVEMLFTVMGPGCRRVSRTYQEGTDLVVGVWDDGRIGTLRGIRAGAANIAGTAFGEKGIALLGPFTSYEPLVGEIISFFDSGKSPVSPAQTLEIFRFIQAADRSKNKGGKAVSLN